MCFGIFKWFSLYKAFKKTKHVTRMTCLDIKRLETKHVTQLTCLGMKRLENKHISTHQKVSTYVKVFFLRGTLFVDHGNSLFKQIHH